MKTHVCTPVISKRFLTGARVERQTSPMAQLQAQMDNYAQMQADVSAAHQAMYNTMNDVIASRAADQLTMQQLQHQAAVFNSESKITDDVMRATSDAVKDFSRSISQ